MRGEYDRMKSYVISIIIVAAVTAIASAILPDGKGRLREQVDFALALAIIAVVILPIGRLGELGADISKTLAGVFDSDVTYTDGEEAEWLMSKREEAFERAICDELSGRFGFPDDDVTVDGRLSLSEGEIHVTSLRVTLSGLAATGDNKAVKKYLSELCGVECEVVIYE